MTRRDVATFCTWVALIVATLSGGALYFGQDLALPGAVGLAVVAAAVITATRHVAPPRPAVPTVPPAAESGRRPFRRLFWLRERLLRGGRSPAEFRLSVLPVLAELADDRLRRRHAIDRHADAAAARALLGDELTDVLDGDLGDRVPAPAQIARFVDRIEQL